MTKNFFSLYRNNDISPSAFLTERIFPRGSQPIEILKGWGQRITTTISPEFSELDKEKQLLW